MEKPLANRVAVITGGSTLIGRAIAIALAEQGARIAFTARNTASPEAIETSERIHKLGVAVLAYKCDISNENEVRALCANVLGDFNQCDILVCAAGITNYRSIAKMDLAAWNEVMGTNLTGAFLAIRAFLPDMMKQKYGRIIGIGSCAGEHGNPGQANYAASKGGMSSLCKAVAKEAGGSGVTANAVAPGFIKTQMLGDMPKTVMDDVISKIPLRRLGEPEEVAQLVAFLAGPGGGYITGQVIEVNGGMFM